MRYRSAATAFAFLAAPCLTWAECRAWDETAYPDLKGQWRPIGDPTRFDPSKARGLAQQAPLTPEYQALFEAAIWDQAAGGDGPAQSCVSPGMPRVTNGYGPLEVIVTPRATHIMVEHINDSRRIYTDGRDWPTDLHPTYLGYSIGRWIDTDGDGRYDVLEIETRGFKGPRSYEATGIPLHEDSESVITERLYIDKADADTLHDVITVNDHALTRPWTVDKRYKRDHDPIWFQNNCSEDNRHVWIGDEHYVLSGDGLLMPAKKNQAPPDLRYFKKTAK